MKTKRKVELRACKELNAQMNHYILHHTRLLRFNPARRELVLGDLHRETVFRIFGCNDELITRFYPSYHTIKYDLESLWIGSKAEVYEFGVGAG